MPLVLTVETSSSEFINRLVLSMTQRSLRILIVDDSALFRLFLKNVLQSIPGCTVVGTAGDGNAALNQLERLGPDLMTLDVDMPQLNGIETLREMTRRQLNCPVLMISKLTESGSQATADALLEGAFDFLPKPSGISAAESRSMIRRELVHKLSAVQAILAHDWKEDPALAQAPVPDRATSDGGIGVVVIGSSTGGPKALRAILPQLSAELSVPAIVVQHMPATFTSRMARRLDDLSRIRVTEAKDKDILQPARVYIAPGGSQLGLKLNQDGHIVCRITNDPPEHGCRPSVDFTLRSAAHIFGGAILAVILTGMGRDGTAGCRLIHECGGRIIAQHADGCVVYGMPRSVIENQLADRIARLDSIADLVNQESKRRE